MMLWCRFWTVRGERPVNPPVRNPGSHLSFTFVRIARGVRIRLALLQA
jgi:hypothetical protein